MNINDIKFSFKFKLKLMILTILPLLFYGSIGYADNSKIYIKTQDILTEDEYKKLGEEEKSKYKLFDNGLHYFSTFPNNPEPEKFANYDNKGASGDGSMAIGYDTRALGVGAMAVGNRAYAEKADDSSIGYEAYAAGHSSNAIGYQATTLGFLSTAVGAQANAFDMMSTALGAGSYAINSASTALGSSSYAGEISTTVGAMSKAFGKGSVTLGAASYVGDKQKEEEYNKYNNIQYYYNQLIQKDEIKKKYKKEFDEIDKIDQNKENKKWYIESMKLRAKILSEDNNSIEFGTAIGVASKVYNSYDVALGAFSETKESKNKGYLTNQETKDVYAVSVGGEKIKRRIQGLADGAEDDEAVTVAQLKKVQKSMQNQGGNEEVDEKIKGINKKSDLALGGVSNAVAMANLPQVMGDKKFNLAASYGYYGGSHAIAVGFSGTNDKQNFIYKLSGSVNNKGNLAFGIGAGVMLGEVNNKDKKIEDLTKENKEIKENLRNQSAEIQELKEIVRRLMKK